MDKATLFLRLEGPLQSWGAQESKFVIRRSMEAPTRSGVTGLLCAALGVRRAEAHREWLPALASLAMGVRIDRPGVRWWDYHTVGARMLMPTAEGKTKHGALLSRREYLCDASFLVALQGEQSLIERLQAAIRRPVWSLYLGRKCCPASLPYYADTPDIPPFFADPVTALCAVPWRRRLDGDVVPETLTCLIEWQAGSEKTAAPPEAEIWYDVPRSFEPPAHEPRFVMRGGLTLGKDGQAAVGEVLQSVVRPPLRPRADYTNSRYRAIRSARMKEDYHLCVFCKAPATTVQHITYRHAGGHEGKDELRSLCRLCHDAVTMLEYGAGMGLERINPEDQSWREAIIQKRSEIIAHRSMETRKRRLEAPEVE